ncbi:hypothetical protein RvY_01543 [Ramazzottius varieornatus]|uniref:HTH CENPB-type domain-containing protein n=1 Tax=Ramazzottius varieornatus TaxID=947166 RepID=A0A1D1UK59_RAMVA|nr:hypothetical protein RvY_01543 [Ramazzottius varieornatus]
MQDEVYLYVLDQRYLGIEVRNSSIKEKALEIVKRDHGENTGFKALDHWCCTFKKRYSLVTRAVTHTARKTTFTAEDLEIHEKFFCAIEDHVNMANLPKSRVLNMDQTMVRVVAPGKKTIPKE